MHDFIIYHYVYVYVYIVMPTCDYFVIISE